MPWMSNHDLAMQVQAISERIGRIEERLTALEHRIDGKDGLIAFKERLSADTLAMQQQLTEVVEILGHLVSANESWSDTRRANDLLRRARRHLVAVQEQGAA